MAQALSATHTSKADGTCVGLPRNCSSGTERKTSGVTP